MWRLIGTHAPPQAPFYGRLDLEEWGMTAVCLAAACALHGCAASYKAARHDNKIKKMVSKARPFRDVRGPHSALVWSLFLRSRFKHTSHRFMVSKASFTFGGSGR